VLLVAASQDGSSQGTPLQLGPVTTLADQQPPKLARSAAISDSIGATSFKLQPLQQDKVGFAYMLLTRPNSAPDNVQVAAGTATPWQLVQLRRRRLQALSAGTLPLLPASEAVIVGTTFLPPCYQVRGANSRALALCLGPTLS
jgi:hypothetical protein